MRKSILKSIVEGMVNDTTRRKFIDKIHSKTGISLASIEKAYDTGSIPTESKVNVYTLVEKTKWVNPDIKDTRLTRQNPVAKHARSYSNSGGVHASKDKTYSRKVKHRKSFEDSDTSDERTLKFAKWLAFKILKQDSTADEARSHADKLEQRGEPSHTVTAWRMAADMVEKHDNKMGMDEADSAVADNIENRQGNFQSRKLAANLKAKGKTYQYAFKRAKELRDEGKMGSARVWAKAAFKLTHDTYKTKRIPEKVEKVPANLSKVSKLRNLARHNDFEVFRGGEGEIIFSKHNIAFMWSENTSKIYKRFQRKWNEFGSFEPNSSAEEIWQAIEDNTVMSTRRIAVGEASDKTHRVYDYRKKKYVGKPMSQHRAYSSANKRNHEYGADSFHVHDKDGRRVLGRTSVREDDEETAARKARFQRNK